MTKNTVSSASNVIGGLAIGWAISLAPVTGGLSIALVAGGTFLWGIYGTDASNHLGGKIEDWIFD